MQLLNLLFFFVKTACNKQTFSHYNCSIIFVTKWIVIFMVIGMLATPWFLFQVAIPVAQGVLESVPTLVTQGSRSKSFSLQFVDRLLSGEQCKEIVCTVKRLWDYWKIIIFFILQVCWQCCESCKWHLAPFVGRNCGIHRFSSYHNCSHHTIPGHHVNQSKFQPQVWYWRHYSLFSCTWSFFGCFQVMICFVAKCVLFFSII